VDASAESPFPNSSQELLLKVALMGKDIALPAWREWRKSVDFELDVDHGSFRLLPLAYHNLNSFGYSDDLVAGRLKGIYRQSWIKNQQLFYKTAKVLNLLKDAGIKTAVLKGIALTELVYKNYGIRPMSDMDILVPFPEARYAVDVLNRAGFEIQMEHLLEHNLEFGRSIAFTDKQDTEIDLHWYAFVNSLGNAQKNDFWDDVIPIEVSGVQTHSLTHTDNLLHAIVHGIRKNPEPPIRWIADSMMIINSDDIQVDWQRLLTYASKFRVFLQVKRALLYMRDHFEAEIPSDVIKQMEAYKPSYVERVVFNYGEKIGDNVKEFTLSERLYSFYARYLARTNREGLFSIHVGLMAYAAKRVKSRFTQDNYLTSST
jgi:hypothetical protein